MKTLMISAALMLGTAAVAQTTQTGSQQPDPADAQTTTDTTSQDATQDPNAQGNTAQQSTTSQPSGQTVNDPSQSTGPQGVTQQGTVPSSQGQQPMSSGTMSGSMQQPMSGGMSGSMGNMAGMSPQPAASYPPCSRTVTDRCTQTYERGSRRRR